MFQLTANAVVAEWALLDTGFAADVRIGIEDGWIVSIDTGVASAPGHCMPGAILPGMPNLHSHAFQRAFAGCTEYAGGGEDFWSWREAMYGAASRLTPETLAPIAAWLDKELLKGGYTSVAEFHYLHAAAGGQLYAPASAMADALSEGAATAGIGLTLLVGVYEAGGFGGLPMVAAQSRFAQSAEAALDMVALLRGRGGDAPTAGLALHSLRAVPPASLAIAVHGMSAVAAGAPIHIHVAEQQGEVDACREAFRTTPIAWLLDHAPVDERWCLVHATHATDDELRAVARSGAAAGLCPTTEANLGDGLFDLPIFLSDNGTFGIGSDSNVALDAFQELALLEYGQRLRLQKRNVAAARNGHTGQALWRNAARGGGQACGRRAGRIAVGQRADLVAIEPSSETAHLAPEFWLDAAIFAQRGPAARQVMAGGVWLIRDGLHRDETAIDRRYLAALRQLAA